MREESRLQREENIEYLMINQGFEPEDFDDKILLYGKTDREVAKEVAELMQLAIEEELDDELETVHCRNQTNLFSFETKARTQISTFDYKTAKQNTDRTYTTNECKKKITIKRKAYLGMVAAVKELAKKRQEIGGLLQVKETKDELILNDYKIFNQRTSGADFEIQEEELMKFTEELENQGKGEEIEEWGHWWHSHHNMGLFWSGTDDAQFKSLLNMNKKRVLGIVFTTNGEFKTRIQIRTEYGDVELDGLIVEIEQGKDDKKTIKKEIKAMVKVAKEAKEKTKKPEPDKLNKNLYGLENESWYNDIRKPYDIMDLIKQTTIHQRLFYDWTIEDECHFYGINKKEVKQAIAKMEKKAKMKKMRKEPNETKQKTKAKKTS